MYIVQIWCVIVSQKNGVPTVGVTSAIAAHFVFRHPHLQLLVYFSRVCRCFVIVVEKRVEIM